MDISIPYYSDKSRISNSNIGWFINNGPTYLYKMLTTDSEESSSYLERGTMIHEYILQPEEFQKDYVFWDKDKPASANQEKFCKELANSVEIEPNKAILSAYKNAYSVLRQSDDKMLSEGIKIASKLKDYIEFIRSNDTRTMISAYELNMLNKIKENIYSHKLANILLGDKISNNGFTSNEFHINWDHNTYNAKCKSLLDRLVVDFKNHKVIIIDLKTTVNIYKFEDSMKKYDYCRQLMYYTMAVKWWLQNEKQVDVTKFSFDYYIIAIDTNTSNHDIRVFKISNNDVESKIDTINTALEHIMWHKDNNLWEHSKEYYEGGGEEYLTLND